LAAVHLRDEVVGARVRKLLAVSQSSEGANTRTDRGLTTSQADDAPRCKRPVRLSRVTCVTARVAGLRWHPRARPPAASPPAWLLTQRSGRCIGDGVCVQHPQCPAEVAERCEGVPRDNPCVGAGG
jgi:hypothetical protein